MAPSEPAISIDPRRDVSTEHATCTLSDGLRCQVETGGVDLRADMPTAYGGDGSAPNPGVYVRAGMASCLAILIKMTADGLGLDLGRVQVDLAMDFDNAADAATPAPVETRFRIRVDGDLDEAALQDLLDRSLARDPFFVALRDPQSVQTSIERV